MAACHQHSWWRNIDNFTVLKGLKITVKWKKIITFKVHYRILAKLIHRFSLALLTLSLLPLPQIWRRYIFNDVYCAFMLFRVHSKYLIGQSDSLLLELETKSLVMVQVSKGGQWAALVSHGTKPGWCASIDMWWNKITFLLLWPLFPTITCT